MSKKNKAESKFNVTFDLIQTLRQTWLKSNDYEKGFIEIILGAIIFYLPTNKDSFSGMIFENASNISNELRVKEHQYPRKISAKELLLNPPKNVDKLKEMYYNKYGIWNLVTKDENNKLRKYQKNGIFENPKQAYNDCGIKLIEFK